MTDARAEWPAELPLQAQAVLDYWFRDPETDTIDAPRSALWFRGGKQADEQIRSRFEPLIAPAARGDLEHWSDSPAGRLALIVVLDQFPRNCYRGTADAFAYADAALALCDTALQRGDDTQLPITGQVFMALPLEHDESLLSQDRSVAFYTALLARAPQPLQAFAQGTLEFAIEHRDIVRRFGRFPHRNEVLGRDPTEEERLWLRDSGKRFGQ